jgi:hypothetical protein
MKTALKIGLIISGKHTPDFYTLLLTYTQQTTVVPFATTITS